MNRAGEPLPESSIEKRKASQHKGTLSREVRKRAGETRTHNYFAKLAERGIYRCPECWASSRRRIDLKSAFDLGRHRRFQHKILGRSAGKTEDQAEGQLFQCPHCERSFPKQHGLSIHISSAHQISTEMALTPPTISKELTNGDGRTQAVTQQPEAKADRNGHRHSDAALAQALAIAHVTGIIENVILTVAAKYDLPPRQFASRVVVSLGERYQEER
jgi:hypothetical protein